MSCVVLLRPAGGRSRSEHSGESGTAKKVGGGGNAKILGRCGRASSEQKNVISLREVWLRRQGPRLKTWGSEGKEVTVLIFFPENSNRNIQPRTLSPL